MRGSAIRCNCKVVVDGAKVFCWVADIGRYADTLISDDVIESHIVELLQGSYNYDGDLEPYIDWNSMAQDSQGNWYEIEFDGQTYWTSE